VLGPVIELARGPQFAIHLFFRESRPRVRFFPSVQSGLEERERSEEAGVSNELRR